MQPSLWAYSILSAIGALPFLILPVLAGGALAVSEDGLKVIGVIAILMTVGEFLASFFCPIIFGGRFNLGQATFATVLLGVFFAFSVIDLSVASLICWTAIGLTSGVLQYFGTTIAVIDRNPIGSSQLRLAVSLLVSGAVIATSSLWIDTGYTPLRYALAALILSSAVLVWSLLVGSNVKSTTRSNDEKKCISASLGWVIAAYATITLLFVVIPPFMSALPALIDDQPTSATLFQLGLGKILAAPILFLLSMNLRVTDSSYSALAFGAIVAATAFFVVQIPSIAMFLLLEICINSCVALLLGRYGNHMSVSQKKWFFLCIQVGSVFGFASLKYIDAALLDFWLPIAAAAIPMCLMMISPGPTQRPKAK